MSFLGEISLSLSFSPSSSLMPAVALCPFPRDLTECALQARKRMATDASGPGRPYYNLTQQAQQAQQQQQQQHDHRRPTWSLNDLSTELLAMIFEHLCDVDSQHLFTARLLCRRFNQIATPIAYKTLVLTERITSRDAEQRFPQALAHIYAYTNHVIARSNLDPAGTRRILERIRNLSTVRWRYVDREVDPDQFWMPADVLNAEQARYHDTRLYVEELPLRDFEGELRDIYIRAIPVDLLVSLKTAFPTPPLVTRLNSLKHLLIAARHLEVLRFEDRGQGTQFDFAPHERLPALRELSLHSIDFHDLAGLHTLHCEDFSAHHPPDLRAEATRGLHALVKTHIRALTTLQVTVHVRDFPIAAVLAHGATLTTLRLRDHTGFDEEDRPCPSLPAADLALLAWHLPRLRVLELDMDAAETDTRAFLRAACGFRSLHTLTLHVQTVLRPFHGAGVYQGGPDRDYEAAVRTFRFLVRNKAVGSVPWRSITINVGGWKRVLVRRLSAAWRCLNEKGIFAERCFVMEIGGNAASASASASAAAAGTAGRGMFIKEEFPVEASRHVTPEFEGQDGEGRGGGGDGNDNDDLDE
ncbi:hypothetical protein VP1G_04380 [Cytospora mali]|uniref:F-box domain-containing protein n=1 Tax=Cytospora mali TaxID=578113 RepID=A0A194UZL4_CYTMA|nr:hypothetical protein VP1G_04380 [Valsa mali var. pyri (nom. inval.)]